MNKDTDLIRVLQELSIEEQEMILALIIAKGNKLKAAAVKKMDRIKYAGILEFICQRITNILEAWKNGKS